MGEGSRELWKLGQFGTDDDEMLGESAMLFSCGVGDAGWVGDWMGEVTSSTGDLGDESEYRGEGGMVEGYGALLGETF